MNIHILFKGAFRSKQQLLARLINEILSFKWQLIRYVCVTKRQTTAVETNLNKSRRVGCTFATCFDGCLPDTYTPVESCDESV